MNLETIKRKFPHASTSFIKANLEADNSGKVAIVECTARNESLAANKSQERTAGKLLVRFVSVRKRLLDPDNLAIKWTLDSMRYAGIISGDEPEKISVEIRQRKTVNGESEHTLIEIFE